MFLKRLSNTKRETYKQCGLKYLLEYEDKVPDVGGDRSPLNFGSFIHEIFELGVNSKSLQELEVIAEKIKPEYPFDNSYNGKVKTCLKNFLRLNSSLSETVGVEMNFTVTVVNDVEYQVIIDRVVRGKNGGLLVIDYKTSKKEKTRLDLVQDNQLRGYVYAISKKENVPLSRITACHYYPLSDNLVTVNYLPMQINGYLKDLERDIWDIRKKKKVDLKPRENEFCSWCGKKFYCEIFNSSIDCKKRIDEGLRAVADNKSNEDKK